MPKNDLQTLIALISPQRAQVAQSVKYGEQLKELNHLPRSCIICEYATTFFKISVSLLSLGEKGKSQIGYMQGRFRDFLQ